MRGLYWLNLVNKNSNVENIFNWFRAISPSLYFQFSWAALSKASGIARLLNHSCDVNWPGFKISNKRNNSVNFTELQRSNFKLYRQQSNGGDVHNFIIIGRQNKLWSIKKSVTLLYIKRGIIRYIIYENLAISYIQLINRKIINVCITWGWTIS